MIKVFAFDLDGTLTQHKTPIDEKNLEVLKTLSKSYRIILVGAGGAQRIYNQLRAFPGEVIGNYGMQYARKMEDGFAILRDECIPVSDRESVESRVNMLREKYGFTEYVGDNVEYHPSGTVTVPLLGCAAALPDKLAFDPDRSRRRRIYSEVVELFPEFNVFVGGTSSFDMAPKPYNKYYALDRWCNENGIDHSEVIYVGDDYGLGGNDECVYHSDFRFVTTDNYKALSEILAPWIRTDVPDVTALLGEKTDCPCGVTHSCEIEKVLIRRGALSELPAMCRDYKNILLVDDENTRRVAGAKVAALLEGSLESEYTFVDPLLVPNESAVERLGAALSEKTDLIIGVGSGVINDLCKYVANGKSLPYYIVATAPSMDGYASKGAAMLFDGMKITTNARVPRAIIADTEVISEAPIEMLRAGYGDIIGKYSCLNDWRLGRVVTGEPLCEFIYNLTLDTVRAVAGMGERINSRDPESVAALMRALVLVGIAMAYMGNSRPASGSEHHLSHYFEVTGLLRSEPYLPHGIDVAYSTYVTAILRKELISIVTPTPCCKNYEKWESEIRRVYYSEEKPETAEGIVSLQKKLGWIYIDRAPVYLEKWDEIKAILSDSPTPEEILGMLHSVGLSLDEFKATYSKEKLLDAILFAKDLKDRFTVLWPYSEIETPVGDRELIDSL